MRKYVNVVGVGAKRTSKKGWDYVPVSFTYEANDKDYTGLRAATVNVGFDVLDKDIPLVGDTLEVVMHESNFILYVDAVL